MTLLMSSPTYLPRYMFPYFTHTQCTTTPAVPTFLLHLHVRGSLVDTFEMDSQEDLDLVVARADEV